MRTRVLAPRVLVELSPALDMAEWARLHARGEVPDRVPYGLNRLAGYGLAVLPRTRPRSGPVVQGCRIGAKLTGGKRWLESMLGDPAPGAADVRLFWDEQCSVPALLTRGNRPVVTGVIWATERRANGAALARLASKAALRRADALFVNSYAQVPVLCQDWGVPASRVHFVPLGIDTDFWDPAAPASDELPRLSPAQFVLSVGNDRHRDHQLLLAAMQVVHPKLPEVRLELVTRTPHRIPPEVGYWRQWATPLQLRDHYRRAQVVAICARPNIHASGLTATLESMAMARAVVATRTPGLEDYIVHGETGLLVPPNDPEALAWALIELLTDRDKCARMGLAARRRVLSAGLSTEAMSKSLASVIRSVA